MTEISTSENKISKITVSDWDTDFFNRFSLLRNIKYEGRDCFLDENSDDLKKELKSPYFIKNNVIFEAVIFERNSRDIGRLICYYDPYTPEIASFGYFEAINDDDLITSMNQFVDEFAKRNDCKTIRGPLQGNFFFSYRMKTKGTERFYGEPFHEDFYPQILKRMGYEVSKRWHTTEIDGKKTRKNFGEIRKSSAKKNHDYKHLKLKFIFPWRWNNYLEIIYDLFMRSYKNMPEYTPIDFETFKNSYNSFKYILNPFFSYLITFKGEPVGFCINFFDPLKKIYNYQEKTKKIKNPILLFFLQVFLIIRLKFNFSRLLIMYVGRVPTKDGREIKGIQALVSKYLGVLAFCVGSTKALVCYSAEDSPSNKSFTDESKTLIAEYAMYYKELS